MSLLWTTLLLFYSFPFCTYTLPFWERSRVNTFNPDTLEDPKSNLLIDAKKRVTPEWGTQEQLEELSSRLLRVQRDVVSKKSTKAPDAITTSEDSTVEALSDSTPHVTTDFTTSHDHTPSIDLQVDSESTTFHAHKPHLTLGTKPSPHLTEDGTTFVSHTDQKDSLGLHTYTSTHSPELLTAGTSIASTEGPTLQESTTFEQALSTNSYHIQNKRNSTDNMRDDTTFHTPYKTKGSTLSKDTITPENPSQEHHGTSGLISSSVTSTTDLAHTSSFAEQVPPLNFMKQCMLAILILAVICTIFIMCTIALAAKLITLRSKNKNRQSAVNYTEMRCISSLLPENNQNNKVSQKMKTFTSNVEDSDGDDNTTLNSFLPEH